MDLKVSGVSRRAALHDVIWSLGGAGERTAAPVSAIVAGRAAWAVVTLSAVLLLARRQWRRLSGELSQLSINGLLLAGHWICFFTGVEQGGVAVGTLGFACFPLFVALIGRVIFATPITRRDVAAMVMVAVGLVVISPEALSAQGGNRAAVGASRGFILRGDCAV